MHTRILPSAVRFFIVLFRINARNAKTKLNQAPFAHFPFAFPQMTNSDSNHNFVCHTVKDWTLKNSARSFDYEYTFFTGRLEHSIQIHEFELEEFSKR